MTSRLIRDFSIADFHPHSTVGIIATALGEVGELGDNGVIAKGTSKRGVINNYK